jgi:Flp pilus assembly protein TadG
MRTYWNRSRGRQLRRRRGAAVVEAAIVLPIVIIFLLAIFEYGRYVMTRQILTNAAREGAHYALAHTEPVTIQGTTYGNATADVINIVNRYSGGQKLTGQSIQVYASDKTGNSNVGAWTDAAAGEYICVRISGAFNFIVPQLFSLPSSMSFTSQSVMRSEGN